MASSSSARAALAGDRTRREMEIEGRLALVAAVERYFLKTPSVPASTRRLAAYKKLRELGFSGRDARCQLCEWDEQLRSPSERALTSQQDAIRLLRQAVGADIKTTPSSSTPELGKVRNLPIGETLRKAGLISNAQLEVILKDQERSSQLRIGDILALRGWLNAATIDFFVDSLPQLATASSRSPIGQYLKQAGLLDDDQVKSILVEQKSVEARFGELAVRKGWIKQGTVDVLLEHVGVRNQDWSVTIH